MFEDERDVTLALTSGAYIISQFDLQSGTRLDSGGAGAGSRMFVMKYGVGPERC